MPDPVPRFTSMLASPRVRSRQSPVFMPATRTVRSFASGLKGSVSPGAKTFPSPRAGAARPGSAESASASRQARSLRPAVNTRAVDPFTNNGHHFLLSIRRSAPRWHPSAAVLRTAAGPGGASSRRKTVHILSQNPRSHKAAPERRRRAASRKIENMVEKERELCYDCCKGKILGIHP